MRERCSFDYAIVRVVPRVERGEFLNAGVILFCPTRAWLAAPRSTIIQTSPVHAGIHHDLDAALAGLFEKLVG